MRPHTGPLCSGYYMESGMEQARKDNLCPYQGVPMVRVLFR